MRAELLAVPEHVALRMSAFREKPVHQPDGLGCFAVEHRADADARFSLELLKNRFRIDLVLAGVNNDLSPRSPLRTRKQ